MHQIASLGYIRCIYENLGDIALDISIKKKFLKKVSIIPYSNTSRKILIYRLVRNRVPFNEYIIGGGTLIFSHTAWFEDIISLYSLKVFPLATIGTGVMDPDFFKPKKWIVDFWVKEVLSRMKVVSVRGKKSQHVLSNYGIESVVVGDPALWFWSEEDSMLCKKKRTSDRILGINWGYAGYSYLRDNQSMFWIIFQKIFESVHKNYDRTVFYAVCQKDRDFFLNLPSSLRRKLELKFVADPYKFCYEVSVCTHFIGIKLHSVLLSLLVGIPSVMIAYQPKCEEVMEEIGLEAFTVPIHKCDVAWIGNALEGISEINFVEKIKSYKNEKIDIWQREVLPFIEERSDVT